MPTVTLTPSACTSPAGWTTLYNYLTTNSSYYPRQLIFTYPANAALGAAGVQINKLTIRGYVRNSNSALKRLRFGFRPSASSGVSEWSMRGSSPVLDVAFDAIDGHPGSGYGYQEIERIYVGSGLFINHIRDQFQQGKPLYFGVIQPDSGKSISVDTTLSRWTMTVDYELLGNIPTTDKSSVSLGETLTVNVNRVIGNSSTTLRYKIGSTTIATRNIGTASSDSYTIPASAGSAFASSNSATMTIEAVTTLSGATYGTLTTSVKVNVPTNSGPTITHTLTRTWLSGIATSAQLDAYLQRCTGIQAAITATPQYGASVSKCALTVEGKTYSANGASATLSHVQLTTSGSVSYTVSAIDSRGKTTNESGTIEVLPYSPPQIQAFTVDRATGENALAVDGTYARVTVQASVESVIVDEAEQNSLRFKIQYRKVGETAWTDCDEVTGSGLTGTFTGLLVKDGAYVSTFDDMSGYDFRAAVYDRFSTSYAATQMPTKEILWDVDETNTCMGFGGAAPLSSDTAYYRFYKRTEFEDIVDFNSWTNFNRFARFNEGYKEYKTSEVDTGNKWYDDKRIYRFTIHGTTSLTNASGTFYTLPDMPSDIVHIDAFFKSGSIWYPLPWAQYDVNKAANIYIDGAKICLAFASGWTGTRQVRVVIEYTK